MMSEDAGHGGSVKPRIYGYLFERGSPTAQAKARLRQQQVDISAWVSGHGLAVVEFVAEQPCKPSQPLNLRLGAKKLLDKVGSGNVIVAATFDRLFAAPEDAHAVLAWAAQHGVHFRALDMDGGNVNLEQSRWLATALLAVSAAHSSYPQELAARAVKKREAAAGRYRGGNRQFGATPEEQAHIRALRFRQRHGATLRALADYSTQNGFPLSAPGVKKVLDRFMASEADTV